MPRPNGFFRVDALPRLASGKMDLRKIREIAIGLSASQQSQADQELKESS